MKRYPHCIKEKSTCYHCSLSSHGMDCCSNPNNIVEFLRKQQGLTQTALAEKVGVTYQWIQKIERRDKKITMLSLANGVALADALGIDVHDLLEGAMENQI